jgi:hypothetical protein
MTRARIPEQLRAIGGSGALIALGAVLGGGTFLVLDTVNPSPNHGSEFSLRDPYYQTCREAFQDGRAKMRSGEPGYRAELDADNDGIACEPFLRR